MPLQVLVPHLGRAGRRAGEARPQQTHAGGGGGPGGSPPKPRQRCRWCHRPQVARSGAHSTPAGLTNGGQGGAQQAGKGARPARDPPSCWGSTPPLLGCPHALLEPGEAPGAPPQSSERAWLARPFASAATAGPPSPLFGLPVLVCGGGNACKPIWRWARDDYKGHSSSESPLRQSAQRANGGTSASAASEQESLGDAGRPRFCKTVPWGGSGVPSCGPAALLAEGASAAWQHRTPPDPHEGVLQLECMKCMSLA